MIALLRDAPAGGLLRYVFGPRSFTYREEEEDFAVQDFIKIEPCPSSAANEVGGPEKLVIAARPITEYTGQKPTVDWYDELDQENPKNWSTKKKCFVQLQICILTFAVYSATATITPAEEYFRETWGATEQSTLLVLSMYILGYGIGPLLFSPLSEVPRLGRNIPYLTSLTLFIFLTIAAATVTNFSGLVIIRLIQGILGGPVLATGAASAGDLFDLRYLPYALSSWALFAFGGPGLGPLMSGFAIQESTWRWSMYETLIISGACWIFLVFFFPETNPDTILLRRAERLRRLTGRANLFSRSELKQKNIHVMSLMGSYLTVPFKITILDPSIAFINLYTAFLYGFFYSFFESFPLVFQDIYGFSVGLMGVTFITLCIGCVIALTIYVLLVYYIYEPYTALHGVGVPEYRLKPGLFASVTAPIGVLIFAWCSRPDIHWAVPLVGPVVLSGSCTILYMLIFLYLPLSYPHHSASLFAANTFIRSAFTAAAVHFSTPLFRNLGIGRGNSVLAGLLVGCSFAFAALWRWGAKLRARSRFAGSC